MRNIIVLSFITMDGVMQAPGGPTEDTSGDFKYGGWTVPYFDEAAGQIMVKQMSRPSDLLLGRKTYEIFASYWPHHSEDWPGINDMTKYVVSRSARTFAWSNSVLVKDNVVRKIKKLKQEDGPELQVHGSGDLIQTLLKHDLVDELWLKIFPITLGKGKRLFAKGAIPAAFTLTESTILPNGVIVASYKRAGEVKTGSFLSSDNESSSQNRSGEEPMNKNLLANASTEIHAPVSIVWGALTQPNIIKQWMFGTTVISDWQVGSPIVWKGEWQGRRYEDKGKILKFEPERTLQYSHFSPLAGVPDVPENYHTVTIGLEGRGDQTLVTLSQDHNATTEERDQSTKNWQMMLDGLRGLVERYVSENPHGRIEDMEKQPTA